ncbi:MAG: hypothetical protein P9L90_02150 [Candidatus Aadella gelida]|nr:hypothetical protein [Candidatus Aadella gelida]
MENLFSNDLYKQKTEELRKDEEELKKIIALKELKELERERSKAYLDRVNEFLDGYNPNKKTMDQGTKKLMLGLLFKNIKIAPEKSRKSRKNFFAPFNFCSQRKEKNAK